MAFSVGPTAHIANHSDRTCLKWVKYKGNQFKEEGPLLVLDSETDYLSPDFGAITALVQNSNCVEAAVGVFTGKSYDTHLDAFVLKDSVSKSRTIICVKKIRKSLVCVQRKLLARSCYWILKFTCFT